MLLRLRTRKTLACAEADLLDRAIPNGAKIITLDERGKLFTSPEFSKCLANFRDQGQGHLAFVIGGADGIDPSLRARAGHVDQLWVYGLAAHAGSCNAKRTTLSGGVNFGRLPLSPRLALALICLSS